MITKPGNLRENGTLPVGMTTIQTSAKRERPDKALAIAPDKCAQDTADLMEEVRQLRAAMAVYRQLVTRLLEQRETV
jgi:hypothetical protein